MITLLTILYVFVCTFLIFVVLLQAGRGGGMGAAFGGGSQSVFGGAGAGNFLTKLTVVMAALFMLLSATLAFLSSGSDKALERASNAIKMRDEARKVSANKDKAADTKGAQSSSSSAGSTTTAPATSSPTNEPAQGASPDEPAEDEDVEGAAPTDKSAGSAKPANPTAPAKP